MQNLTAATIPEVLLGALCHKLLLSLILNVESYQTPTSAAKGKKSRIWSMWCTPIGSLISNYLYWLIRAAANLTKYNNSEASGEWQGIQLAIFWDDMMIELAQMLSLLGFSRNDSWSLCCWLDSWNIYKRFPKLDHSRLVTDMIHQSSSSCICCVGDPEFCRALFHILVLK